MITQIPIAIHKTYIKAALDMWWDVVRINALFPANEVIGYSHNVNRLKSKHLKNQIFRIILRNLFFLVIVYKRVLFSQSFKAFFLVNAESYTSKLSLYFMHHAEVSLAE